MAVLAGRLCIALACAAALSSWNSAAAESLSAYEVKAAFLVNFAKFTTWPADAFAGDAAAVVIGVVGADPFGAALDAAARGQRAGDRPIQVKRLGTRDDLSVYQIVFIAASEEKQLSQILRRTEDSPTLPVSDIEGFSESGGVIGFVMEGSRVRFQVNVGAAERRRLRVSTRLLALAAKVYAK